MSNAELRLAIACVAASMCTLAAAQGAAAVVQPPAEQANATIGEITKLARQLKVEQLKKELRDASKKDAGAPGSAALGPLFTTLNPPVPGASAPAPTLKAPPTPKAAPRVLVVPQVAAILGINGELRARTTQGGELAVGTKLATPGTMATVKGINSAYVTFEVCDTSTPVHGKVAAAPRCETRTVAPNAPV